MEVAAVANAVDSSEQILCEFAECALNDLKNHCVTQMAQRVSADQLEIQE